MRSLWRADKACDFGCVGGDQTTRHLMTDCDKFAALRLRCFGTDSPRPPFMMGIAKVIEFLKEAKIASLEIYDSQQQYHQLQQLSDSADSQSDSEIR